MLIAIAALHRKICNSIVTSRDPLRNPPVTDMSEPSLEIATIESIATFSKIIGADDPSVCKSIPFVQEVIVESASVNDAEDLP